jgi:hypothetical protein
MSTYADDRYTALHPYFYSCSTLMGVASLIESSFLATVLSPSPSLKYKRQLLPASPYRLFADRYRSKNTHTHTPILLFSVQYMRVRQRSNSRCIQTHICHQCCKVTALYLSCVHAFVYSMSIRIVGPMHCIAALNPIVIVHSPPSLPFPSSGLCACVHRLGNFFKNPPCDVSVESVEGEATPREAEECCQHVDHQSLYL